MLHPAHSLPLPIAYNPSLFGITPAQRWAQSIGARTLMFIISIGKLLSVNLVKVPSFRRVLDATLAAHIAGGWFNCQFNSFHPGCGYTRGFIAGTSSPLRGSSSRQHGHHDFLLGLPCTSRSTDLLGEKLDHFEDFSFARHMGLANTAQMQIHENLSRIKFVKLAVKPSFRMQFTNLLKRDRALLEMSWSSISSRRKHSKTSHFYLDWCLQWINGI